MSELLSRIKSRGYWDVNIRPLKYKETRIEDISALFPLVEKLAVRLRGWDFPHIDYGNPPHIDLNWVGQEIDWQHHKSIWRIFQSGQFAHVSAIALDWRDESTVWPADPDWRPGRLLGVGDTVFTMTEITLFASRLALSPAGDEGMSISVTVNGLEGRTLYVDSHRSRWPFMEAYTAALPAYPVKVSLKADELVARSSELALELAQQLFKRFGWDPSLDLLRDWQQKRG